MDGPGHNPHYHVHLRRSLYPLSAAVRPQTRIALRFSIIRHARDWAVVHHDAHYRLFAAPISPRTSRRHYRPHHIHDAYTAGTRWLLHAHQWAGHRKCSRADRLRSTHRTGRQRRILGVHMRRVRTVEHGTRLDRSRMFLRLQACTTPSAVQHLALVRRRPKRRLRGSVPPARKCFGQLVFQGVWHRLGMHCVRPVDRNILPDRRRYLGWVHIQAENWCRY